MEKQSRKTQLDALGQGLLAGWQDRYVALWANLPQPNRAVAGMLPAYRDCLYAVQRLQTAWLGGVQDMDRLCDPQLPWHWLGGWERIPLIGAEVGNAGVEGKTSPALRPLEKHPTLPTPVQPPSDQVGAARTHDLEGPALNPRNWGPEEVLKSLDHASPKGQPFGVTSEGKPLLASTDLPPGSQRGQLNPALSPETTDKFSTAASVSTSAKALHPVASQGQASRSTFRYQPSSMAMDRPPLALPVYPLPKVHAREISPEEASAQEKGMGLASSNLLPPTRLGTEQGKEQEQTQMPAAQRLQLEDLSSMGSAQQSPSAQRPAEKVGEIQFRGLADLAASGHRLQPSALENTAQQHGQLTQPEQRVEEAPLHRQLDSVISPKQQPQSVARQVSNERGAPIPIALAPPQPQEVHFRGLSELAASASTLGLPASQSIPAIRETLESLSPATGGLPQTSPDTLHAASITWEQLQDLGKSILAPMPGTEAKAKPPHPPALAAGYASPPLQTSAQPPDDLPPVAAQLHPTQAGHQRGTPLPAPPPMHPISGRPPLPAPEFLMEDMLDHLAQQLQRDFQRIYGH